MWNYNLFVYGWLERLGFTQVTPLRTVIIKNLLHQIVDPDYNPYLGDVYHAPVKSTAPGNPYFQTWADVRAHFVDPDKTAFTSTVAFGYVARAIAAAAYLPGVNAVDLSGQAAWDLATRAGQCCLRRPEFCERLHVRLRSV
jgi:hypothetical protein